MKNISWDALQLFLDVARGGGLTCAATASGSSPATIGRKMLDLEQRLGKSLFIRSQTGYALTADGRTLLDSLQAMDAAARDIDGWRKSGGTKSVVRIALGTWNAQLLMSNFSAICSEKDAFHIDLFIAEQRASLAHRESDIGIRAFEPDERNLAAIKTGGVAYAAYRLRNAPPSLADRWIAIDKEGAISAYLRWPHEMKSQQIAVTVNRPFALREVVLSGAGTAVLPCFIGDADGRLVREGPEIYVLRHQQWLVMNNEDRHRRDIRTVADRMIKLFKQHSDLYAGRNSHRD